MIQETSAITAIAKLHIAIAKINFRFRSTSVRLRLERDLVPDANKLRRYFAIFITFCRDYWTGLVSKHRKRRPHILCASLFSSENVTDGFRLALLRSLAIATATLVIVREHKGCAKS